MIIDFTDHFINQKDSNFQENFNDFLQKSITIFENYTNKSNNTISGIYDIISKLLTKQQGNKQLYGQLVNFVKQRGDFVHQGIISQNNSFGMTESHIVGIFKIIQDIINQIEIEEI